MYVKEKRMQSSTLILALGDKKIKMANDSCDYKYNCFPLCTASWTLCGVVDWLIS